MFVWQVWCYTRRLLWQSHVRKRMAEKQLQISETRILVKLQMLLFKLSMCVKSYQQRDSKRQFIGIQARFIHRISAVLNAIETIDNEMICFIIFCLNCIRHGRNATYEPGLRERAVFPKCETSEGLCAKARLMCLIDYNNYSEGTRCFAKQLKGVRLRHFIFVCSG